MNTTIEHLFANLLSEHSDGGLVYRAIELRYLYSVLKHECLPGEEYLGGILVDDIPTHPYSSLRVGEPVMVISDKIGDRVFRPLFTYNEPINNSRMNHGERRPVIQGQNRGEVFYGYYLQNDIHTLPKIPGCRTGNTIIREGETLVEVFVGKRVAPQELIPEPTKYIRIIKDPKKPKVMEKNTLPKPVPEVQKIAPVEVDAIPDFLLKPGQSPKDEWKEGDKIVVILRKSRGFCRDYDINRGIVIGALKYEQAKITKRNGALWIEINHPISGLVYKTLGDATSTNDISIRHA